jgi:hypothetical protein
VHSQSWKEYRRLDITGNVKLRSILEVLSPESACDLAVRQEQSCPTTNVNYLVVWAQELSDGLGYFYNRELGNLVMLPHENKPISQVN